MLIRSEQTDEMMRRMRDEYHRKLMDYFRLNHGDATAQFSDGELLSIIAAACDRARSYGIDSGEGTQKFVVIEVLINPNFDDDPTVKRYLKQPDLDPDFKIMTLADQVARNIREQS